MSTRRKSTNKDREEDLQDLMNTFNDSKLSLVSTGSSYTRLLPPEAALTRRKSTTIPFEKDEYEEVDGKMALKSRSQTALTSAVPGPSGWTWTVGFYRPVENYLAQRAKLISERKNNEARLAYGEWVHRMLHHVKSRNIWPPKLFCGMFFTSGYYYDYYLETSGHTGDKSQDINSQKKRNSINSEMNLTSDAYNYELDENSEDFKQRRKRIQSFAGKLGDDNTAPSQLSGNNKRTEPDPRLQHPEHHLIQENESEEDFKHRRKRLQSFAGKMDDETAPSALAENNPHQYIDLEPRTEQGNDVVIIIEKSRRRRSKRKSGKKSLKTETSGESINVDEGVEGGQNLEAPRGSFLEVPAEQSGKKRRSRSSKRKSSNNSNNLDPNDNQEGGGKSKRRSSSKNKEYSKSKETEPEFQATESEESFVKTRDRVKSYIDKIDLPTKPVQDDRKLVLENYDQKTSRSKRKSRNKDDQGNNDQLVKLEIDRQKRSYSSKGIENLDVGTILEDCQRPKRSSKRNSSRKDKDSNAVSNETQEERDKARRTEILSFANKLNGKDDLLKMDADDTPARKSYNQKSERRSSKMIIKEKLEFGEFDFTKYSQHRLIVTNLPTDITENDIQPLFQQGKVKIIKNDSKKGAQAVVKFETFEQTAAAYNHNRFTKINGEMLELRPILKTEETP